MSTSAMRRSPWLVRSGSKALVITLALSLTGPLTPLVTLAQESITCSINGFCVSSSTQNLLGLPQGTLNIVSFRPWDRVVKSPEAAEWVAIESEARAALATLHGVANDNRLPYAALDELRATMYLRLLSIARKKATGSEPLTAVEQSALLTFTNLLVERRVRAAQRALDEYARWQVSPCSYTVPSGFGFTAYVPGPQCSVGGVMLGGPPRPPTKEQFTAYGAALALREREAVIGARKRAALGVAQDDSGFIYDPAADNEAALRTADEALGIGVGVLGAVAVGGLATIAAVSSVAVASTFAAMAGSFAIFGTTATSVAVGSTVSAAAVGVGVAASIPAIIIMAAVVAVVYTIQFAEDQSVLPMLQESLELSRRTPDIWAVGAGDGGLPELFSTFIEQTLPSFDEQRLAEVVPAAPGSRGPGDPQFVVNDGLPQDVIVTKNQEQKLQETFMSQGWFVSRTQTDGTWSPWRWRLTLTYRGANLAQTGFHTAGIQPDGFFNIYETPGGEVTPAIRVARIETLNGSSLTPEGVRWHGNRAPRLNPIVSAAPTIGTPVTFTAGASDADAGDSIVRTKWFIESAIAPPLAPDFRQCTFNPPGGINPVSNFPYQCPWVGADDSGGGVSHTYTQPGTWGVLVMTEDSHGAVTRQQFNVVIQNLAPTLTIVTPAAVNETQPVNLVGTVNFPNLSNGSTFALTTLVVDWADGQVTRRAFPCAFGGVPSDFACQLVCTTGSPCIFVGGSGEGPWAFDLSHSYAYAKDRPVPAQIRVYAETNFGGRSQTEHVPVSVSNVTPTFEAHSVCPPPNMFGVLCLGGDQRTIPMGSPLTIRARIVDAPDARHFVKVLWGDGTSSALTPGCSEPGCPGTAPPWLNGSTAEGTKYLSLAHTYQAIGDYPITIVVDDGGPSGTTSYQTQASIYGISPITGPAEAAAGEPIAFAFTSKVPAGLTPTLTPTCGGGQLLSTSTSSFTCQFNDVAAKTAAQVSLQAVILGTTFNSSLNIDVLPKATSVSPITGPTTVTEGQTFTYHYSETHSALGTVLYGASCGSAGTLITGTSGSSLTCRFTPATAPTTTVVNVVVHALGGSDSEELTVNILRDEGAPVLSLPSTIQVLSTSNSGAAVGFTVSAVDAISGSAAVTCSAQSGAVFPIGSTTVSCSAVDWKNNSASGSFLVVVLDKTPPSLGLPASMELNATSPAGAVVNYSASATDALPASPAVSCAPASGTTFAVGTTVVNCSATDSAGNPATGTFSIKVLGALDQIVAVQKYVEKLSIDSSLKKSLLASLAKAATAIVSDKPAACSQLANVISTVDKAGTKLSSAQANRILREVETIRAVAGC